jgi:hypothetical protein
MEGKSSAGFISYRFHIVVARFAIASAEGGSSTVFNWSARRSRSFNQGERWTVEIIFISALHRS